jgi:hypothetical protein
MCQVRVETGLSPVPRRDPHRSISRKAWLVRRHAVRTLGQEATADSRLATARITYTQIPTGGFPHAKCLSSSLPDSGAGCTRHKNTSTTPGRQLFDAYGPEEHNERWYARSVTRLAREIERHDE